MLQYEIYTHVQSSPPYSVVQVNKEGTEMHYTRNYLRDENILVFDENLIYNKTVEMVRSSDTNLYHVLIYNKGMRINYVLEATSTPELAKELYEATNGRAGASITFINKLTDGIMCLRATDRYEPTPVDRSIAFKPIYNDPHLIMEVRAFMDLYKAALEGNYPEDGHRVMARDGALQSWYPFGGLKGQKKRLLEDNAAFLADYKVDVSSVRQ